MGTTADKLSYLNTTKQKLKTVINTTGAELTNESTFRSYANVLNDQIIGAINGEVDLWSEYPKVEGSGTEVSLTDTVEARLGLIPRGNTSQDGTPTPDNPIMPKVVTGENSVKVENKNLFDKENTTLGRIDTSGAVATITGYYTSDFIKVEPNTSYTKNSPTADAYHRFAFYTSNDTSGFISVSNSNTITTPSNCKYLRFCGIDGEQDTTLLVKGTTATDYVEHKEQNYPLNLGNIEFVEIGDYADYIEGTPNNWVKKEAVKKIKYNDTSAGGGDFATMKTNGYVCRYFTDNTIAMNYDRTLILSNRFKGTQNTLWNGVNGEGIQIGTTSSAIFIAMSLQTLQNYYGQEITSSNFPTAWKSYFDNNETYIWYPLATPTEVPITDTTLINQLNALYYARSYDGETNISTSCENGNMPMKFSASALEDVLND